MSSTDPTLDPARRPWLEIDPDSGWPLQHLPWASFRRPDRAVPRLGVRIGDVVVDIRELVDAGLFRAAGGALEATLAKQDLTALLGAGPDAWRAARERVADLLTAGVDDLASDADLRNRALLDVERVALCRPCHIGDFVDFYSSLEHATNVGKLFRPDSEPLLDNWRHLPVGYHGRSRTIVVTGTPVRRPCGQRREGGRVVFGPTQRLDYELELGFVMGPGNRLGERIAANEAAGHVFGVVLVNDWSARDLQAWEYQPLGPFLGKSFATSIGGWVTPLSALAPSRVAAPEQHPAVLAYLRDDRSTFDLDVGAAVRTATMRRDGVAAAMLSAANLRDVYWTFPQQVAHLTVNGASTGPGDLLATGTISGRERRRAGSLLEISWNGSEPVTLPTGEQRTFLEDGDEVILSAEARHGPFPLTLGEVHGTVVPAA